MPKTRGKGKRKAPVQTEKEKDMRKRQKLTTEFKNSSMGGTLADGYQLVLSYLDSNGNIVNPHYTGIMFPDPVTMSSARIESEKGTILVTLEDLPNLILQSQTVSLTNHPLYKYAPIGDSQTAEKQGSLGDNKLSISSNPNVMISAVSKGNINVVSSLLTTGRDPKSDNGDNKTSVHYDAYHLLEERDAQRRTPLMIASENGNIEMVKLLIKAGADIHTVDNEKKTILAYCVGSGKPELIKILLEAGAAVDQYCSKTNYTALMLAAEVGDIACCQMLLEFGANPQMFNCHGNSPKHIASWNGHIAVKGLLVVGEDCFSMTCVNRAAEKAKVLAVKRLLNTGADPNSLDKNHYDYVSPLKNAVRGQSNMFGIEPEQVKLEIVNELLKAGADVNWLDSRYPSPVLHEAAFRGFLDISRTLIKAGADVNLTDWHNKTSLWHAADYGHLDVVKLLLESGAEIDHQDDNEGQTALTIAACRGETAVVQELLKAGAPVDTTMFNGYSTLMCAVRKGVGKGIKETVKLLLSWGADPNYSVNYYSGSETAITILQKHKRKNPEAFDLLVKAGRRKVYIGQGGLQKACKDVILNSTSMKHIEDLPLPTSLVHYLMNKESDD